MNGTCEHGGQGICEVNGVATQIDIASNGNNCGGCGRVCHGVCSFGHCLCGWATIANIPPDRCGNSCTDLASDAHNCGACGHECNLAIGEVCYAGACGCAPGSQICNGQCQNTTANTASCGACGHACDTAAGEICVNSQCGCPAAHSNSISPSGMVCNNQCTVTADDPQNCGACGHTCDVGAGQSCRNGQCICPGVEPVLSGGHCIDLDSDPNNCGAIGHACGAGVACASGLCACGQSGSMCGNSCVDINSDATNCGACGHACAQGESCFDRGCRASGLAGTLSLLAGSTSGSSGSTDAAGDSARLYGPTAVVADDAGNLYVADTENSEIRKIVLATQQVTTVAGKSGFAGRGFADGVGSSAKFRRPQGLALDGHGNLYVGDSANGVIRKIDLATSAVTTVGIGTPGQGGSSLDGTGSSATFGAMGSMVFGADGRIYLVDQSKFLRRVDLSALSVQTLAIDTAAGVHGNVTCHSASGDPTVNITDVTRSLGGIAVDASGQLYLTDTLIYWDGWNIPYGCGSAVLKVAPDTLATSVLAGSIIELGSANGTGAGARFQGPSAITIDPQGNLFVMDGGNAVIRQVTSGGVVTTPIGSGQSQLMFGALPASIASTTGWMAITPSGGLVLVEQQLNNLVIAYGVAPF